MVTESKLPLKSDPKPNLLFFSCTFCLQLEAQGILK